MNKQIFGFLEASNREAQSKAIGAIKGGYSVDVVDDITQKQREVLSKNSDRSSLEVLSNTKSTLVKRINNVITEMIFNSDELPNVNYSDYISEKLHHNYTYLSNIFSRVKGTSIQQFIMMQKIEKVKKLLLYEGLTLTEVSFRLHYSSVAHLSNQFKKITGITPSFYIQMQQTERACLENLGYL